jgi:hypothetical protein
MQFEAREGSVTLNPFATATAEAAGSLLRAVCADGLPADQRAELEDQIEAVVPAVIELRDAGHLVLTVATLLDYGTLSGLARLAEDERLTELSRSRCAAIRNRLMALSVKAVLGHS